MELTIRIIGEDLDKVDFGQYSTSAGQARFLLGIQKGQEVIDAVEADAGTATFTALFTVSPLPEGATNFLGPYAHGTRTARFCYLCWRAEHPNGTVNPFARVKLHLSPLRWERVEAAVQAGTPITMRLSLVGKGGKPVCASVPNESIHWEG